MKQYIKVLTNKRCCSASTCRHIIGVDITRIALSRREEYTWTCTGNGMWWHPSCPCWEESEILFQIVGVTGKGKNN